MKIASVVFTFVRHDYLHRCLSSLEKCVNAGNYDWYFFQDGLEGHPPDKPGYYNYSQEDIEKCIDRVRSTSLPTVGHLINATNKGINYQVNQAFRLFGEYDIIFFFEQDLVVSPYYLLLLDRFTRKYPRRLVSFHTTNSPVSKNKRDLQIMVKAPKPRCWGFGLANLGFQLIKDQWRERFDYNRRTPYYDTTLTQLARKHMRGKYQPKISRAVGIGKEGILSTNATSWQHRNLHLQNEQIYYPEDKNVRKFVLK